MYNTDPYTGRIRVRVVLSPYSTYWVEPVSYTYWFLKLTRIRAVSYYLIHCTQEVFSETNGYKQFRNYLNKTFGDIDATRTAERKLKYLWQTTSATAYASKF
jgi:hypothetical protein